MKKNILIVISIFLSAFLLLKMFKNNNSPAQKDKNSLFLISCGEGRDLSTRYATESRVLEGKTQYKIRGDWFSLPNNCSVSFVDPRKQ